MVYWFWHSPYSHETSGVTVLKPLKKRSLSDNATESKPVVVKDTEIYPSSNFRNILFCPKQWNPTSTGNLSVDTSLLIPVSCVCNRGLMGRVSSSESPVIGRVGSKRRVPTRLPKYRLDKIREVTQTEGMVGISMAVSDTKSLHQGCVCRSRNGTWTIFTFKSLR